MGSLRALVGDTNGVLAFFDGTVWGTLTPGSGHDCWSISGTGLDDIWVGNLRANQQYVDHWDGNNWTSYLIRTDGGSSSELTVHAPFPGVCFVGYNQGTSSSVRFFRYDSGGDTFVDLGSSVSWGGGAVPLVISPTLCYFSINGTGGAFPSFRKWDTGVWSTHPTGLGLPDGGMAGIILHQGEIFIHKGADLYRGQWGGPWTKDNSVPFSSTPATQNHSIATDGNRIVIGGVFSGEVWIRNGPDNYTSLGLSGVGGAEGQVAIAGNHVIQTGGNTSQEHDGIGWSLIPNADSNGVWLVDIATAVDTTNDIDVFVVAEDVLKLNFDSAVAVTESLFDPNSYAITLLDGSTVTSVVEVLPIEDKTTTSVFLRLSPKAGFGDTYRITLPSAGAVSEILPEDIPTQTLFDPGGVPLATMSTTWTHHRTKIDSVLSNIANMYDKKVGGILRTILQAITISDEEIGGDF
jgi:hypothetical protein